MQRLLVPLFTLIWWWRLHSWSPHGNSKYRSHVIKVKGWRTAVVSGFGGQVTTTTFLFNIKGLNK